MFTPEYTTDFFSVSLTRLADVELMAKTRASMRKRSDVWQQTSQAWPWFRHYELGRCSHLARDCEGQEEVGGILG